MRRDHSWRSQFVWAPGLFSPPREPNFASLSGFFRENFPNLCMARGSNIRAMGNSRILIQSPSLYNYNNNVRANSLLPFAFFVRRRWPTVLRIDINSCLLCNYRNFRITATCDWGRTPWIAVGETKFPEYLATQNQHKSCRHDTHPIGWVCWLATKVNQHYYVNEADDDNNNILYRYCKKVHKTKAHFHRVVIILNW